MAKAVRDVERMAQLQDDSVAARDLLASIKLHAADWQRLLPVPAPVVQRLVETRCAVCLAAQPVTCHHADAAASTR